MERNALLWAVVLGVVMLAGCGESEPYKKGHEAGHKEGYDEGLKRGQKIGHESGYRSGFTTALPGTNGPQSMGGGFWLHLVMIAAALKVLFTLIVANISLIRDSATQGEKTAKIIVTVGAAVMMMFVQYCFDLDASGAVRSLATQPASIHATGRLGWGLAAGAAVYLGFEALLRVPFWSRTHVARQVVMVFVLSSITGMLVRAFWWLIISVPNVGRYFATELMYGVALGSIFFVVKYLISPGKYQMNLWFYEQTERAFTDAASGVADDIEAEFRNLMRDED